MKVWLPRNAKRLAALTLTLVLVLALAACGAQTDEPAATATPAVEPPAVATPTPAATAQSGQSGADTGAQALTDVLADIAKNVQLGVTGSSLKAVPYAVKLLDWGAASTMTQSEIKTAVVNWLGDQGNDEQVSFSQQMDLIDTTCQTLMGSGARDLLDSAGCQNVKGDWPVQASDRVEAILEAVGLRG
ncbi:MAG: hypothetical protein SO080_03095 [Oscillospiraceae bacterium]|nr:hypothetical protein [Oscillospiraceae bacterium]